MLRLCCVIPLNVTDAMIDVCWHYITSPLTDDQRARQAAAAAAAAAWARI